MACSEHPPGPRREWSPPCPIIPPPPLASGAINASGDSLEIVLVQPANNPSVIMIRWPQAPTITTPARYNDVASAAMRLLAEASTMLARIRASMRV
jgi:hypothetical protein